MTLRRGIEVENGLEVALAFFGTSSSYDAYVSSDSAFDEADLRVANRGGARISAAQIAAILERRNQALGEWEATSRSGAALFGEDSPVGQRLVEAADFFAFIHTDLDQLIKHWRAEHPW